MSDSPQSQDPGQQPNPRQPADQPKDPCGEPSKPDPRPRDPCADPGPPHDTPPCPPVETSCPKPPCPCSDPPGRPCPPPDPCDEVAEGDPNPKDQAAQAAPTTTTDGSSAPPADPVAAQLKALRDKLEAEQEEVQKLEPLKTSMADLVQRIQTLEKTVDEKATAEEAYKDFYNATEIARNDVECFIPTVRCQLTLTDDQKKCICKAIAVVDQKVGAAARASRLANIAVQRWERKYKAAADDLAWARKWFDFLKTGLQQQVAKQRDDLKALKQLADPKKDQCETWFYLYELERLLKSETDKPDACWQADIWISTFIDCWRWDDCYKNAWNKAIVTFNEAEANEKLTKSQLEQAKKRATDLEKVAKEYEGKRREWILKEIKAAKCCGPFTNCPPDKAGNGASGRAAR
jgi:hypothetical protein